MQGKAARRDHAGITVRDSRLFFPDVDTMVLCRGGGEGSAKTTGSGGGRPFVAGIPPLVTAEKGSGKRGREEKRLIDHLGGGELLCLWKFVPS